MLNRSGLPIRVSYTVGLTPEGSGIRLAGRRPETRWQLLFMLFAFVAIGVIGLGENPAHLTDSVPGPYRAIARRQQGTPIIQSAQDQLRPWSNRHSSRLNDTAEPTVMAARGYYLPTRRRVRPMVASVPRAGFAGWSCGGRHWYTGTAVEAEG